MSRPTCRLFSGACGSRPRCASLRAARPVRPSRPLSTSSSLRAASPLTVPLGTAAILSALGYYLASRPVRLDELVDDPAPPQLQAVGSGLIPYSEVQKHNSAEDCWVVIDGKVYDLTEFATSGHPGGAAPIHRAAGHDATAIFQPLHPPGTIENGLDESAYLGVVDPQTLPKVLNKEVAGEKKEKEVSLAEIIGLPDFDADEKAAAKAKLTAKAWAYMSSGATDQYSLDLNRKAWNMILFRPRILINVDEADTRTKMMGQTTNVPFFISPTGMAGLAHPLAERGLARAAGDAGVIQMVSTNASTPIKEIVGNKTRPDQPFFMQLYVDRNRPKTEALLKTVNDLDLKALFVTVDAAVAGKREADERSRAEIEVVRLLTDCRQSGQLRMKASGISGGQIKQDSKGGGIGRSVGGFIDPKLCWDDIAWLRRHTKMPIGLKGVQSVEDAVKASEMGVDAIYLSNHGGRALDTANPSLYTLMEIRKHAPQVFDKCEIYLDGGVRRGTDVVKALCLGATGVGLGRPFLYSLTYGKEGVDHAIDSASHRRLTPSAMSRLGLPQDVLSGAVLQEEVATTMRLLGVTRIDQLGPHLLNTRALDSLIIDQLPASPFSK